MEVILLKDVKSLGKKDEVVKVSDGYARNFILKKGLGIEANASNMEDLKYRKKVEAENAQQLLDEAKALKTKIESLAVEVAIKAGEGGKTFGSVASKEIADALKKQHKIDVDKRKIVLEAPIKSIGGSTVSVKLHPEVTADLKVNVREA